MNTRLQVQDESSTFLSFSRKLQTLNTTENIYKMTLFFFFFAIFVSEPGV